MHDEDETAGLIGMFRATGAIHAEFGQAVTEPEMNDISNKYTEII